MNQQLRDLQNQLRRDMLIDNLIATLAQTYALIKPRAGVLGPVKKVYKVPEPARTPSLVPPVKVPEEAPKEPVKV